MDIILPAILVALSLCLVGPSIWRAFYVDVIAEYQHRQQIKAGVWGMTPRTDKERRLYAAARKEMDR